MRLRLNIVKILKFAYAYINFSLERLYTLNKTIDNLPNITCANNLYVIYG